MHWKHPTFQGCVDSGLYELDWGDGLVFEGDFGELVE